MILTPSASDCAIDQQLHGHGRGMGANDAPSDVECVQRSLDIRLLARWHAIERQDHWQSKRSMLLGMLDKTDGPLSQNPGSTRS